MTAYDQMPNLLTTRPPRTLPCCLKTSLPSHLVIGRPDRDTTAINSYDNPFAGPQFQPAGKVLVCRPTDDWLCKKHELNVILVEGYLSCSSEASGLLKDQVIRQAKTQARWYGLHIGQEKTSGSVSSWSSGTSKLNSSYSQISQGSWNCFNTSSISTDLPGESQKVGEICL